jgi:predicted LPLAT superfamily acyltransferase
MAVPDSHPEIFVVIPVYNHAATLRGVVEGVLRHHSQVLVVDDGSTDSSADTLEGLPVELLCYPQNRGKVAALVAADEGGMARGLTHMISLDADGQHDPEDLPKFFAAIENDPRALIVGTRNFDQDGIPGSSRFGRTFSNFWLRLQTGSHLKDSQSGFRAYPLFIFEQLNFWTHRYNFEIEVLVRSAWAGVDLRDIDIAVYYPPGDERVSHFRGFIDNLRLTILNTHLTMRSVVPWPHRKIIEGAAEKAEVKSLSVFRPLSSIRQLLKENSSPKQLAVAAGVGILLGTLPLLFCHTIAILFVCGFFRLNKVAAVSASQLCMPPLVPAVCIEVGYYLRNGRWLTDFSLETLGYQAVQRLYEWFLGSLLVAPVFALIVAIITYRLALMISREGDGRKKSAGRNREEREARQRWTSRSIGSSWQHQSFYLMIRFGGRRAAYALLYCVVFYYVLLPSVRQKCRYYLSRRFPEASGWTSFWNSYRMTLELGKVLVDRALVGILGSEQVKVGLEGKQELLDLLAEEKGLILINAHVGCWQVAMSALEFVNTPVNLLMQREEDDIDRHYYEHAGIECPYRIIDPRGYLGGVLEMVEVLKRGELLSVMGDRMLGDDRNGVEVEFMGGMVTLPFSAYKLASATGAPIVVLFSYKTGFDSYALKLYKTIRIPAGLGRGSRIYQPFAREFAESLEDFCREHPFQFFNFFDMWQNQLSDSETNR